MENIFSLLIGTCSTLLGIIIGSFMSGLTEIYKRENDIEQERKKVYTEYINAMQRLMNETSNENFVEFQKVMNTLLLYASSRVVNEVNTYYMTMTEQGTKGLLKPEQHAYYQNKIINLMRKDIDKNAENVESIKLIAFKPRELR